MTPRECARIQSFPDSFKINPKDRVAYKQFGNSVNVEVVTLMAKYMFGDVETRNKYSK
jgi:DNA (cytosine-5)-methyltransferase 1